MKQPEKGYFFSIQPFWTSARPFNWQSGCSGQVTASTFCWKHKQLLCVPGNGQVGIMLCGPEDFSGACYGVVSEQGYFPLNGLKEGCFVRFSPGTFSQICAVPAKLIDPYGMPVEDIFSHAQLAQMKDAMASEAPVQALLDLFGGWMESSRANCSQERQLASHVTQLIWESGGQIRIQDLEQETTYSTRHLLDVVSRQVGIAPKQMCRQVRFQNALHLLEENPKINLSSAAFMLGYTDQSHFSKEFKSFSGLSPSQFQRGARMGDGPSAGEPPEG